MFLDLSRRRRRWAGAGMPFVRRTRQTGWRGAAGLTILCHAIQHFLLANSQRQPRRTLISDSTLHLCVSLCFMLPHPPPFRHDMMAFAT